MPSLTRVANLSTKILDTPALAHGLDPPVYQSPRDPIGKGFGQLAQLVVIDGLAISAAQVSADGVIKLGVVFGGGVMVRDSATQVL